MFCTFFEKAGVYYYYLGDLGIIREFIKFLRMLLTITSESIRFLSIHGI
jgi:hypothetical protein